MLILTHFWKAHTILYHVSNSQRVFKNENIGVEQKKRKRKKRHLRSYSREPKNKSHT